MDSALRPRDIQARIRAGESVDEVARAAGVPVERIEPFAAPVVAERQHVAGLALSSPVRRRGETTSHRPLRSATTESLVARGIDPDDVNWDAALLGSRRWQVRATFAKGDRRHEALFVYDQAGRFSVAGNDDARWMIGESTRVPVEPAPTIESDEDDELALVRAIQDAPPAASAVDVNDAYTETELAEVDGLYDIVPGDDPEMDALYDMLASFDEDSVKIYSGLVRPDLLDPPVPDVEAAPSAQTPPLPEGARVEPLYVPDDVAAERAVTEPDDEPTIVLEPEQPTLLEPDAEAEPPRKTQRKSRRASVPSWDEIMFGAPRQGPDRR